MSDSDFPMKIVGYVFAFLAFALAVAIFTLGYLFGHF